MPQADRPKLSHPALFWRDGSRFIWCRFTDARGRVRRASTRKRDEKAAVAAWRQLERATVGAADRPAHEASLTDTIRRFLDLKRQQGKADDTVDMYVQKARHLVGFFGAELHVSRIDAALVDAYVARREGQGAAQGTVHKELVALRGLLRVAARRGEFRGDPRSVMPIGYSAAYKARETTITREQLAALLAQLPRHRAAALCFYVATGARKRELARARLEDLDLEGGFVRLRGTKTKHAERWVPITSLARPLLERAKADHDGWDGALFSAWDWPYKLLERACARAGVPRVTPNDLRRSFCTWLQERGVANEHLAKLMGHASTTMVDKVYGRARPKAIAALLAVSDLDAAGLNAPGGSDQPEREISGKTSRPRGVRTHDQRIKSPAGSAGGARVIPLRPAPAVSDPDAPGFGAVRLCGPPSIRRGLKNPRTFGGLLDQALALGDARGCR
jgi:integrase